MRMPLLIPGQSSIGFVGSCGGMMYHVEKSMSTVNAACTSDLAYVCNNPFLRRYQFPLLYP